MTGARRAHPSGAAPAPAGMVSPSAPGRPPRVSVIIVSFNSAAHLEACLEAVGDQAYPDVELIVVDNASRDGSASLVRSRCPHARLVANARNRGFAAAVLQGSALSTGDVLALLNPDAVPAPTWLGEVVAGLQSDPRIAVAGSKVLEPDGRTLQHAGGLVHPNALTTHRGRGEIDRGQYDELVDVDYVTGAAIALRVSIVGRTGFLDPGYFPAYYEELELCVRARTTGYRVVYVPRATVIHHEAASSGRNSETFLSRYHASRLRFVLKNYRWAELVRTFLPAEAAWLRTRPPLGSLARAYLHTALRLPAILVARARPWSPHV